MLSGTRDQLLSSSEEGHHSGSDGSEVEKKQYSSTIRETKLKKKREKSWKRNNKRRKKHCSSYDDDDKSSEDDDEHRQDKEELARKNTEDPDAVEEHLSKDDAQEQFLQNCMFFSVRKLDDPIGLLPGEIILGINEQGVHFFRPIPKEHLLCAKLRDIMQFGQTDTAVFFKMRVAGALHFFQFETKLGEEICVALQTHINDAMQHRYAKARTATGGANQEHLSKDDAKRQFLQNSVLFNVRKIDDPTGLLPREIILGINKQGVHFFRPFLKEHLLSAKLRDIMQFGQKDIAVFFKMRVAGSLQFFQFETKLSEEICVALQTHINDAMQHRYAKACTVSGGANQGDNSQIVKGPGLDIYEKRVQVLSRTVKESQKNAYPEHGLKDDAKQLLNSVFFIVRKIDDPLGLLPREIVLGINIQGVHFFNPLPAAKYLLCTKLRDIVQFGQKDTAVFFKLRVAGALHFLQFETKLGKEICVALQTHINEAMQHSGGANKKMWRIGT